MPTEIEEKNDSILVNVKLLLDNIEVIGKDNSILVSRLFDEGRINSKPIRLRKVNLDKKFQKNVAKERLLQSLKKSKRKGPLSMLEL